MKNLTNKRFGKLLVIKYSHFIKHKTRDTKDVDKFYYAKQHFWECKCDCDKIVFVRHSNLINNSTKSCGCLAKELTHGLSYHYISPIWSAMKSRCLNPGDKSFERYGGRGIKVCKFLQKSPKNLLDLLGERKHNGFYIDRKDNDGNYSCGNCEECKKNNWPLNLKWSPFKESNENKSFGNQHGKNFKRKLLKI